MRPAPSIGGSPRMAKADEQICRLYIITPPRLDPDHFRDQLSAALDAGEVGAVQLRLKDADDDTIRRAADALFPVADSRGVVFILNDRPDLAAETGCDGVHIGQTDASYSEARTAMGSDAIIGVTCHDTRDLAVEACELGADYVAFGAFFATDTKQAKSRADVTILQWWSHLMVLPSVAIGGITPENCAPLVQAGADFLAVVSAVWDHPDGPAAGVETFNRVIAAESS